MGPFTKGRKCDVIWVEVDKMYVLVQRPEKLETLEDYKRHFENIHYVASGMVSALAGHNASGFSDLEPIIDSYVDKQIEGYFRHMTTIMKTEDPKSVFND